MTAQLHNFDLNTATPVPGNLITRLRNAAETMSNIQIGNLLVCSIQNALDAQHCRDAEIAYGNPVSDDTAADVEYYTELACAWSVIARERGIDSLEAPAPSIQLP